MNYPDDDKEFEIDLTELEKIKNSKPQKANLDMLFVAGDQASEYEPNSHFEDTISLDINDFSTNILMEDKKDYERFLAHKKHHKIKTVIIAEVNTKVPTEIIDHPNFNKEITDETNNFYSSLKKQEIKPKTFRPVKVAEQKYLKSDLELLSVDRPISWGKHASLRKEERFGNEDAEDFIELEKQIKYNALDRSINTDYELFYTTHKGHKFKVAFVILAKKILIITLYRVDKESKKEYAEASKRKRKSYGY